MSDPMPPLAIAALVIGFPLVFAAFWSLVVLLVSRLSGWHRLARTFAAQVPPGGTRLGGLSGRIGIARYRNCLTAHVTPSGFFLGPLAVFRMGHPTLFVPWEAVTDCQDVEFPWGKAVLFKVGLPPIGSMLLPSKVFEARLGET